MKKMRAGAAIAALAMMTAAGAMAEVIGGGSFTDWERMATYSGAMAAVMLIVQFLKIPAGGFQRVPMRLVVYATALAVVLGARVFSGAQIGVKEVLLAAVNAVAVALGAMELYERTLGKGKEA